MGYLGDIDDSDVPAKVLECKRKGLSDFEVEGQLRRVRAFATDPLTGRQFYLMLNGTSGPDDFAFLELIDGYTLGRDGAYVDIYSWSTGVPGTGLSHFMELVGGEMDDAFWDAALSAFLDLYDIINQAISTALYYAEYEQGEHMTQLCQGVDAEDTQADGDDTELAFQAFTEVCAGRAPFAEYITVEFPDHTDLFPEIEGRGMGEPLPRIAFGYRPGEEAFVATGSPYYENLFLNGVWTTKGGLELDLAENLKDPWDRHGARAAARDLIAIQSAAIGFIKAEFTKAKKDLVNKRTLLAFEVFGGYEPADALKDFDAAADDWLRAALSGPVKRVEDFLASCCAGRP